jgi:hypothetical protein
LPLAHVQHLSIAENRIEIPFIARSNQRQIKHFPLLALPQVPHLSPDETTAAPSHQPGAIHSTSYKEHKNEGNQGILAG